MTKTLIKCFIKNYEDITNPKVREAYGHLGSMVGIIANLILCLSKMGIGLLFKSMAIFADGINNLSDAGSSVVTLIGFKLSAKPADEDHPFGHARIEYISGMIVSFIILLLGLELIRSSISKILNPEPILFSPILIMVLVFSIMVKLWLSRFNRILGTKIQSTTMIATATDSRNDVLATSAVLLATIIAYFTGINLDGLMGGVVGAFIFYSGISLIKETTSHLLGQAPDPEFVNAIQTRLLSYKEITGFHDLVIHSYGPNRWFASVHAEVPADANLLHCHDIIDNIERDLQREMGIDLVIHMDPIVTNDPVINDLKAQVKEFAKTIDPRLSIHDFRMVMGPTHSNIIFDIAIPIGFKQSPSELAKALDTAIKSINPDYYTVITVDTNYISTSIASHITNQPS